MNAEPEGGPRQPALPAARLAELRRERAERLVRLRGGPDARRTAAPGPAAADAYAEPALAAFLRALRAAIEDAPPAPTLVAPIAAAAPAAAVLPFLRAPARSAAREADPSASPAPPGDLDRLPGVGPGLVWALEQAGIARLADLAASAPAPLADRLGPIGGLIDLPGWIAFARSATGAPPTA